MAPRGAGAGEQLVQQHAQAVDVGGGADGFAAHLFGAGVVRRVGPMSGHGGVAGGFVVTAFQRVQRLGDAEVQQLDAALGVHQHVAGFQVAVHQQVAVGVDHGVGQLQEQPQPPLQRQPTHGLVDRAAVHVLQHEVGQSVVAGAGVQQARDVRVAQPRQGLALQGEAPQHRGAVHAALEQLHGGAAVVLAVGPAHLEDLAHAAAADGADDLPGTQALPDARGARVDQLRRRLGQEGWSAGGQVVVLQQRHQLGVRGLVERRGGDDCVAFGGRRLHRGLEQGLQLGPAGGVGCRRHRGCGAAGAAPGSALAGAKYAGQPQVARAAASMFVGYSSDPFRVTLLVLFAPPTTTLTKPMRRLVVSTVMPATGATERASSTRPTFVPYLIIPTTLAALLNEIST